MQSELPFYEDVEEALRGAVRALGGSKKVGPKMWPDKTEEAASRLLLDCINSGRPEKLEVTQIMRLFRMAKEVGCHGPFAWFAGEVGYDVKPITAAQEKDRLTTVVEQAMKTIAYAIPALERIQQSNVINMDKVA